MNTLRKKRRNGLTAYGLRIWALLFAAMGMVGRGILQNRILGVGMITDQELFQVMEQNPNAMNIATAALLLQAVETCAVPIFSFLLAEGFQRTSDRTKYILRVCGVALLSEIPYDLAMSGKLLNFSRQNPAMALVLSMVMLLFFVRYEEKGWKNTLIKLAVTVAACLWTVMLKVEFGFCIVLIVCVLWIFRENTMYRGFIAAGAAMVCTLISPLFITAPMGVLTIHFYNGQKGYGNRTVNYLAYPVMLLLVGVAGMFF